MKFVFPIMRDVLATVNRWAAELRRVDFVTVGRTFNKGDMLSYNPTGQEEWTQREVFDYQPDFSSNTGMTYTSVLTNYCYWWYTASDRIKIAFYLRGTTGGTAGTTLKFSIPFRCKIESITDGFYTPVYIEDGAGAAMGFAYCLNNDSKVYVIKQGAANWGLGANRYIIGQMELFIYPE